MVEQVASWPYSKQKNVISKLTRSPDDYIEDRVQFKINQYVKKASRYRWAYRILASTAAIGSATVPVLINIPGIDFRLSDDTRTRNRDYCRLGRGMASRRALAKL